MVEKGLIPFLQSDPTLSALIASRVFLNKAPQAANPNDPNDLGALPRIVLHRISTQRPLSNDGPSNLAIARIQCDCHGLVDVDARNVSDALRKSVGSVSTSSPRDTAHQQLHGYIGTFLTGSWVIQGAWIGDDRDSFLPSPHSDDVGVHQVSCDLTIAFGEQ